MSKINLTVEQINRLEPTAIATNELVRAKFIQIYEAMWTPSTGVSGEAAYERESRYFGYTFVVKEHKDGTAKWRKTTYKSLAHARRAINRWAEGGIEKIK